MSPLSLTYTKLNIWQRKISVDLVESEVPSSLYGVLFSAVLERLRPGVHH